jgi:hypothetical protein
VSPDWGTASDNGRQGGGLFEFKELVPTVLKSYGLPGGNLHVLSFCCFLSQHHLIIDDLKEHNITDVIPIATPAIFVLATEKSPSSPFEAKR